MGNHTTYPKWWTYIVECADSTYYTGLTHDINQRLEKHNSGSGARYTRSHGPVRLVYAEEYPTRSDAAKREYEIKQLTHAEKALLVDSYSSQE